MSQLINVMARLKVWSDTETAKPPAMFLHHAETNLMNYLSAIDDDDSEEHRKVSFLLEQLRLSSTSKFHRQYSPQLTIMSYLINASSCIRRTSRRERA